MKRWNGLVRKEWQPVKWPVLTFLIVAAAALFLLPEIGRFVTGDEDALEITLILSFLAAALCTFIPVLLFLLIFYRDMKRPDLWLHSTASLNQLIGAKLFVAMTAGGLVLLLTVFTVAIRYFITNNIGESMFDELLFFGILLMILLFAASVSFLIIGYLFSVLDHFLRPYLKSFSVPVLLAVFVIGARLLGEFENSAFYNKYISIGKIDLMRFKNSMIEVREGYFELTNTYFHIGALLFNVLGLVAMFLAASYLLEKKVRL